MRIIALIINFISFVVHCNPLYRQALITGLSSLVSPTPPVGAYDQHLLRQWLYTRAPRLTVATSGHPVTALVATRAGLGAASVRHSGQRRRRLVFEVCFLGYPTAALIPATTFSSHQRHYHSAVRPTHLFAATIDPPRIQSSQTPR